MTETELLTSLIDGKDKEIEALKKQVSDLYSESEILHWSMNCIEQIVRDGNVSDSSIPEVRVITEVSMKRYQEAAKRLLENNND